MKLTLNEVLDILIGLEDEDGRNISELFMELPDKELYPDYYGTIKKPISFNEIKEKNHKNMDDFETDIEQMVENACEYNAPGSQIYKDALTIKEKFYKTIGKRTKKGSSQLIRLEKLIVGKETYRIGDFVYIENESEPSKPLIVQIFEIWSEDTGAKKTGITACWYLRPENTVHRSTQKFYPNEVFKASTMTPYFSKDIIGKCCVLYIKDYVRGKPKDIPSKDCYICELRYLDTSKSYTKIKSWNSCLPESVRGEVPELDLFDEPLVLIRSVPSVHAETVASATKKRKASEEPKDTSNVKRMAFDSPKIQTSTSVQQSETTTKKSSTITTPATTQSSAGLVQLPTPQYNQSTPSRVANFHQQNQQKLMQQQQKQSNQPSIAQPSPAPKSASASKQATPGLVIPDSVVSLFDINENREIKWYFTPPIQIFEKPRPVHSLAYLKWKALKAVDDKTKQNTNTQNIETQDRSENRPEFITLIDEERIGQVEHPTVYAFKELQTKFENDAESLCSRLI